MSLEASTAGRPSFVTRAINLILRPKAEWTAIDAEAATIKGLYVGYVMILAAIPAVCAVIGGQLFGVNAWIMTYKPALIPAIVQAVLQYLCTLGWIYVLALIIDVFASSFGGQKNQLQAFKVAAYVGTPAWVAGVLLLITGMPVIGMLVSLVLLVAAVYCIYELYLGLRTVMKAPQDKAALYTLVVCLVGAVTGFVLSLIIGLVMGMVGLGMVGGVGGARGAPQGTVSVPGVGSVDIGKLDAATKAMEAQQRAVQGGQAIAVPAETLGALLPASVGGYTRGEVSNETSNAGGFSGSTSRATYTKGERSFTLSITDMGSMAGIAQMADAVNISHSESSSSRYEKTGKVDGRLTSESFERQTGDGKYGVLVGSRFMVEADGNADSIDELKAAVKAVPFGRLEAMAK